MSDADLHVIAAGCTQLEALLAWDLTATDDTVVLALHNCPNLTELDLSFSNDISCEGFQVAGHSWQLQVFAAASCSGLDDVGVYEVVASCPHLRDLDVSCCEQLTDDAAHAIARYGSNLEALNIEGSLEISVEGIREIGKNCRKLQKVGRGE